MLLIQWSIKYLSIYHSSGQWKMKDIMGKMCESGSPLLGSKCRIIFMPIDCPSETQIRTIIYAEPCALFWPRSIGALLWNGTWTPSSGHTRTVQKIIQFTQLHILCTCLFYSKVYKGSVIFYIFVFKRIFVIPFCFLRLLILYFLDWTFFTDYFYTPFLAGF